MMQFRTPRFHARVARTRARSGHEGRRARQRSRYAVTLQSRDRCPPWPSRVTVAYVLALVLALVTGGARTASAHALLVRAIPSQFALLQQSPPLVHIWFTEDLNGAASKIIVWDRYRHNVTTGAATLVPGHPREMEVRLQHLRPGTYLVLWTSVSAEDGHLAQGYYTFSVKVRGPGPSLAGVSLGSGQGFPDAPTLGSIIAHWLELLAVITWVGATAFGTLVLPLTARHLGQNIMTALLNRLRLLSLVSLGALLLASTVVFLLDAYGINGNSWRIVSSASASLFSTQYGELWIVRQALGVVALALTIATFNVQRSTFNDSIVGLGSSRAGQAMRAMWAALALGLVDLYLFAASGHAASARSPAIAGSHIFTGLVFVDWMHLLGAAIWLGGQTFVAMSLVPAIATAHDRARILQPFLSTLDRFSPWAYTAVGVALVSGVVSALIHIPSLYAFADSIYGRALIVKLVLTALMVLVSAYTVFLLRPSIWRTTAEGVAADGTIAPTAAMVTVGVAHGSPGAPPLSPGRPEPMITGMTQTLTNRLLCWLRVNPVLGAGVLLATSVMFYYPVPIGFSPPGPSAYTVQAGGLAATITIKPDRSGPNTIVVTLRNRAGKPVPEAHVTILSTMLDMVMGTGLVPMNQTGAGRFVGTGDLGMGGRWQLQLLVYLPSGQLTRMYVDVRVGA